MATKVALKSRSEILIKKVFISGFTWRELENYFNLNKKILYNEVEERFKDMPSIEKRKDIFNKEIQLNEARM